MTAFGLIPDNEGKQARARAAREEGRAGSELAADGRRNSAGQSAFSPLSIPLSRGARVLSCFRIAASKIHRRGGGEPGDKVLAN